MTPIPTPLPSLTTLPPPVSAPLVADAVRPPEAKSQRVALWSWLPVPLYTLLIGNSAASQWLIGASGPRTFQAYGVALFPKWTLSSSAGSSVGRRTLANLYWTNSTGGAAAVQFRDQTGHAVAAMGVRNLALAGFTLLFIWLAARSPKAGFLATWSAAVVGGACAGAFGNLVVAQASGTRGLLFAPVNLIVDGAGYGAQFGLMIGLACGAITAIMRTTSSPAHSAR